MAENNNELDCLKANVVKELFIKTADQNYIIARWCFLNHLYLDFYWNGLHAVEKYLKAALLLNGQTTLKYGHDIHKLFSDVCNFASKFFPETLEKPAKLGEMRWTDEKTNKFIERLNRLGSANNRYNLYGFAQHPEDLHKLDQLVFRARNVAQRLDGLCFLGNPQTQWWTGPLQRRPPKTLAKPSSQYGWFKPCQADWEECHARRSARSV